MLHKLFFNPVSLIVITLLTTAFWFSLYKTSTRIRNSAESIAGVEQEINALSESVSDKKIRLDIAKQPLAKEKIARNELLLQKPGEFVLRLPEVDKAQAADENGGSTPNWLEWWRLLISSE